MHGAGNDYIYVDARKNKERIDNPSDLSIRISDRHFGVGSDGLVMIMDSEVADFRMRMFNADGSEAGMCGNASRCVGKYVYELGMTDSTLFTLETASGIKTIHLTAANGKVQTVSVDMGEPSIELDKIPVAAESNQATIECNGQNISLYCLSMGNPHAVTFVDDVDSYPVEAIGTILEHNPIFPERCNIEFAQIISSSEIKMRVWERGSGETLACGTGACATLVAAATLGKADRKATLKLIGGDLNIQWHEDTNKVTLSGGAEWICSGEYDTNP